MAEKAGTTKDKAAAESTPKKRTILTAAERIAKAKAEVEKLEAKEKSKAKAKLEANAAALSTLEKKKAAVEAKIDELTAERHQLQELAGVTVGEALPPYEA